MEYNIFGRIVLDMYIHMMKETKLSSYTLNSVAYQFLGESKEEVHHSQISVLQSGTKKDRVRLCTYCLKDSELPMKLVDKLKCIYNYAEMAKVTGIPVCYLFNKGQQVKVKSQILRNLKQYDYIWPAAQKGWSDENVGFQGADVLDAQVGFYNTPITTLDFASLYPSIMISNNLCYSTLCNSYTVRDMKQGEDYIKTPNGHYFVTNKIRKGILPIILSNLLQARSQAKRQLGIYKEELKGIQSLEDP